MREIDAVAAAGSDRDTAGRRPRGREDLSWRSEWIMAWAAVR